MTRRLIHYPPRTRLHPPISLRFGAQTPRRVTSTIASLQSALRRRLRVSAHMRKSRQPRDIYGINSKHGQATRIVRTRLLVGTPVSGSSITSLLAAVSDQGCPSDRRQQRAHWWPDLAPFQPPVYTSCTVIEGESALFPRSDPKGISHRRS